MNSFTIAAADGGKIQIPAGEYYFNTKARARRMMLNSLTSEARQVYACLELATMGFQQELAVTMSGGVKVPLTSSHIQAQTGLSKQHVRRSLAELEAAGLVERRGIAGGPLLKGRIEIYSWAEPRTPKPEFGSQRAATKPVWFPTSWAPLEPLLKRLRIGLLPDLGPDQDAILAEGERIARDYQNAEMVVTRFLKGVCAPKRIYKDEITERTTEINGPASERANPVESSPVEDPLARTPQEDSQTLLGRRRYDEPDWHDRVANCLEILPIPTVLDKPMLMQITKTLSEEFVEQFIAAVDPKKGTAYAATSKDGKGIRNWAGVLSIAKQVVARGVVNTLAPRPGGKPLACGFCNKPIEGGAINGSHFECWEAATQQVDARRSALEDAKGTAT